MSNGQSPQSIGRLTDFLDYLANVRQTVVGDNLGVLLQHPEFATLINQTIQDYLEAFEDDLRQLPASGDGGLSSLIGIGADASSGVDNLRMPPKLPDYDEQVVSERLLGIADLYYIYQHERLGVFRAVLSLQELFKAGKVRLADGDGAVALYQYDRQKVLRHTQAERMQAYRRVFGYTDATPPTGAKPNTVFHTLFTNFNVRVAQFFRDTRVSEVVRHNGGRDTFASVAVVRRAGLDLRNNLKQASYGDVVVLRTELMQLLEAAFEILSAEDIRNLYGAESGWDALEEILKRHRSERLTTSIRNRLAATGYDVLQWLAQPYILAQDRTEFRAYLEDIADSSEEWLTSAESLGLSKTERMVAGANVVPLSSRRSAIA